MSFHRTGAAYIEPDGGEDETPGVHDASEQRDQASSERHDTPGVHDATEQRDQASSERPEQASSKSHEKLHSKLNTKHIWQDARYPVCQLHLYKYIRLLNII